MEIEKGILWINLLDKINDYIMNNIIALFQLSDKLVNLKNQSLFHPIDTETNLLDFFGPGETDISELFKRIFNFNDNEKQFKILENFAIDYLESIGFDPSYVELPEITAEQYHIDVLIMENSKYAIIFENKLNGAQFQRNQLARYIEELRQKGFADNQIWLVLLPLTHPDDYYIPQSVWRCPTDWKLPNDNRKCSAGRDEYGNHICWCDTIRILKKEEEEHCYSCIKSNQDIFKGRTIILHQDFSNWLLSQEERIATRQIVIRSTLMQLADYLNGKYISRENDKLNMEIKDFLRKELDVKNDVESWRKISARNKELEELVKEMKNLMKDISHNLIDKWYEELKDEWPEMEYEPKTSFGIKLQNNIWCGCMCGVDDNDNQPYWGLKNISGHGITNEQHKLVEEILNRSGLKPLGEVSKWIAWNNTLSGDVHCRELFSVAKELCKIQ